MAGRLEGKVAVITGGCSGIGLGAVELFIAEGAKVVAADIQDEKGAMLEARFGESVRYAHCDVTSEDDIVAALKLADSAFGGLDILFNNAGISDRMGAITEVTAEGWDWIFSVLVRGPALGMKHAAPMMIARGGGSIINTASVAAYEGQMGQAAYSASKGGIVGMTLPIARDLSTIGIRVNTIVPGLINTPLFNGLTPEFVESLSQSVLYPKRLGRPEEIAQLAAAIIDNDYINGECIRMDGGIRMQPR